MKVIWVSPLWQQDDGAEPVQARFPASSSLGGGVVPTHQRNMQVHLLARQSRSQ
jgi:hypothetical protein